MQATVKFIISVVMAVVFFVPAFTLHAQTEADADVITNFDADSYQALISPRSIKKLKEFRDSVLPVKFEEAPAVADLPEQKERELVVMVYMNAKNDVDKFAMSDIKEMEVVGSTDKVAFVVEVGRIKKYARIDQEEKWIGTRRYFIQKDDEAKFGSDGLKESRIVSPVIALDKNSDMGDYKNVIKFGKEVKKQFPAKNYMLIIWNHGLGYLDPKKETKSSGTKGIAFDDETGNYIRTRQMGTVLKEIGGIDVYASNACLMQTAEVVYEMYKHTKFIVGSQEVLLAYGFDYTSMASFLNKSAITPLRIAEVVVGTTGAFFDRHKAMYTISAIDTSKVEELIKALKSWSDVVLKTPAEDIDPVLFIAALKALRFYVYGPEIPKELSPSADFGQFVKLVELATKNKTVKEESEKLFKAVKAAVRYNAADGKLGENEYKGATGLSIGLPRIITLDKEPVALETNYLDYSFVKHSDWGKVYPRIEKVIKEILEQLLKEGENKKSK